MTRPEHPPEPKSTGEAVARLMMQWNLFLGDFFWEVGWRRLAHRYYRRAVKFARERRQWRQEVMGDEYDGR